MSGSQILREYCEFVMSFVISLLLNVNDGDSKNRVYRINPVHISFSH